MELLEFEDIKEIFLQFKSLHKNIQELTSKKSNREDYLLISVIC
jgi:hypothetical protein